MLPSRGLPWLAPRAVKVTHLCDAPNGINLTSLYQLFMNRHILLADIILVVHALYATTVVIMVPIILIGWWRNWEWVRNFWFRLIHLIMIGIVVVEVGFGWVCPLTTWENQLRLAGGELESRELPEWMKQPGVDTTNVKTQLYQNNFIARMIHPILFFDASQVSEAVLNGVYLIFGISILALFIFVPPHWPQRRPHSSCKTS